MPKCVPFTLWVYYRAYEAMVFRILSGNTRSHNKPPPFTTFKLNFHFTVDPLYYTLLIFCRVNLSQLRRVLKVYSVELLLLWLLEHHLMNFQTLRS